MILIPEVSKKMIPEVSKKMIPDVSKLNWSDERPAFEDVEGKLVFVTNFNGVLKYYSSGIVKDKNGYTDMFGNFYAYAIIDTAEELLWLDGFVPSICESGDGFKACCFSEGFDVFVYGTTREEAIHNFNKLVRRLENRK